MPTRKRIRNSNVSVTNAGGGVDVGGGNIAMGPDFGQNPKGEDDTGGTMDLGATPDLSAVDLLGELVAGNVIDITNLDLDGSLDPELSVTGNLNFQGELNSEEVIDLSRVDLLGELITSNLIDLEAIDLSGDLSSSLTLDDNSIDMDGNLTTEETLEGNSSLVYAPPLIPDVAIDLFSVDPAFDLTPDVAIDLFEINPTGSLTGGEVQQINIEVVDWIANEDVWLDENSPNTNRDPTLVLEVKNSAVLSSNEKTAYIQWDVGGTFALDDDGNTPIFTETDDRPTFVFYINHGAGILNNPADIDWQLFSSSSNPFDETTATWNNSEPPAGTERTSGSVTVDNTQSTDGTFFSFDLYRAELNISGESAVTIRDAAFGNNSQRYWWLRFSSAENSAVDFDILSKDADPDPVLDDSGREMRPSLSFTFKSWG